MLRQTTFRWITIAGTLALLLGLSLHPSGLVAQEGSCTGVWVCDSVFSPSAGRYVEVCRCCEVGETPGSTGVAITVLPPPTPTPRPLPSTGKRIEVSISKQRMYVWQGDTLLYTWVCSTGKSGSGTAAGRFQVQSKIPEAWGGQWSLRMPYWLGIYWAGTLENGIHALPILSNGQKLWDGYLGQRVSYGCIILSTEAAKTIYDWAEIGTPVIIRH